MPETFETFIESERKRLNDELQSIHNEQRGLQEKLEKIHNELRAIEAYEAAKSGKAARARASGGRRAPSRRGSKRDGILQAIKDSMAGLTRGELLEKMGLKGDKSGEMSVSNALTALTKGNQVARREGKYHAA
jgi:hypothetical protein